MAREVSRMPPYSRVQPGATGAPVTAAVHSLWMLRNVPEVRDEAGHQHGELLREHEQHLERLQAEAFARPSADKLMVGDGAPGHTVSLGLNSGGSAPR